MLTWEGATVLQQASDVAEGFSKYGPYVYGLSIALVALAAVSALLLRAKNREVDRSEKRVDELTAQVVAIQEKRIADRDAFQGKLDSLAREVAETVAELTRSNFALTRAVEELHTGRRRVPPPKESSNG